MEDPMGKVIDAIAAVTAHEIWKDYCDLVHRDEIPPAER